MHAERCDSVGAYEHAAVTAAALQLIVVVVRMRSHAHERVPACACALVPAHARPPDRAWTYN